MSWDGMGGFTKENIDRDGGVTYSIINNYHSNSSFDCYFYEDAEGLTCEPTTVYNFPPEKRRENDSLDEYFYIERFRLTQKDDKFGLVRDVLKDPRNPLGTYTEEILKPIYLYEDIPNAAYKAWVEREIYYYARLISRTPRCMSGRTGDGWDAVPLDIRKEVRAYMETHDMKQPEKLRTTTQDEEEQL